MSTVLVLDDQPISRMILEELIRSIDPELQVASFADPVKALEWAKKDAPSLIITDYKMPNMNGVEFTQWLRQIPSCTDVPIVIVTCIDDKSVRYKALEAGATDFLSKPIDHYECRARCKNLLQLRSQQQIIKDRAHWLEQQVDSKAHEVELREKETLLRLARAGEYRDEDTGNHVVRMAGYAYQIAQEMGLRDTVCQIILHAAPMHDIGKIGIPDHILLKRGKLSAGEWSTMQSHTLIGYEILRDSPSYYLKAGAVIALGHHERYDGKGYPNGTVGRNIPVEARVVAIADVFDALLSKRPYKEAWSMEQTLEYMQQQRGKHFDPQGIDAFFNQLDQILGIRSSLLTEASALSG